jgi:Tol biopolymer transport system component
VTKSSTVDLYTAKADGSGVRRLTHAPIGVVNHHPSWSPDGRSIVYVKEGKAGNDLWIIGVNGRGNHRLTWLSRAFVQYPDW